MLSLPDLNTLGDLENNLEIDASAGAEILVPSLASIDSTAQVQQNVDVDADGSGTEIDLSGLTSFNCQAGSLSVTDGATVLDAQITSLNGVSVALDGTGTLATSQWATLTGGTTTITGGTYTFGNVSDIDNLSIDVLAGSLALPGVEGNAMIDDTLQATGAGATLSLPALTSMSQSQGSLTFDVAAGGEILMPLLTSIDFPDGSVTVAVGADGSGSEIDLSGLTTFNDPGGSLSVTDSATVLVSASLTSLTGVDLTLDGTGTLPTNQFTSLEGGSLTVTGGSYALGNLADIDGSNISVTGGSLTLASVASYSNPLPPTTFEATGAGAVLGLPSLASLAQGNLSLEASGGGQLLLPSLASINASGTSLVVAFSADGTGTEIDLSGLITFNDPGGSLSVTNDATVLDAKLTGLAGVSVTLDGSGIMAINQWASLTAGSMTITGGSTTFSGLSDIDDSSLSVFASGSLSLPAVTSFAGPTSFSALDATGSGAVLSLPALASLGQFPYGLSIDAEGGGQALLPSLASIDNTTAQVISVSADGSGSTIDLSGLTSVTSTPEPLFLSITDGATLLDAKLTSLSGYVAVGLDGTGTFASSQITTIAGTFILSGGPLTLSGLTAVDLATISVTDGATLNLPSGITYGTTTLEATGTGSTLALAGTTLAESTNGGAVLLIEAMAGGVVTMSALTSITGGPVALDSNGAGSLIDLSALQTFTSSGGATTSDGGSIECGITLPAAPDVWINTNPMGGDWSTAGNWLLGTVPGANSSVIVSTVTPTTITLSEDVSVSDVALGESDTLIIDDGFTLSTTGDFTNSGSLNLDAGCLLSVGGNETETTTATINEQIGGTPALDEFGVLAVTGTVTLAGTLTLVHVDELSLSAGQDFPVITFASASGTFHTVTGLTEPGSSFGETLNAKSLDLIVQPAPPIFIADTPPVAAVGTGYSYQFQTIGTPPSTFSATGLPGWAQLDANTGMFSGTPPAAGTFSFSVTASNGTAPDATVSVSLVAQIVPLTFTADAPPVAAVGSNYSYQFQASGTGPITFSATGLPDWAQLDASTGILSGTPPAAGTFSLSVTASNGIAPDVTENVSLVAQLEPPTFTADSPPLTSPGSAFSYQFQATGTGIAPITFSATGLPNWAQFNTSTGLFSGTPPADGTFNFNVTASNGILPDTTVSVSLIVGGGTAITFNIPAGTTFTVPDGTYSGGTTFNVGAGAMVTIPGGTFIGGAVFNVATGAVVDLTGQQPLTLGGALIGSGDGTVEFSEGCVFPGSRGYHAQLSRQYAPMDWRGLQYLPGRRDQPGNAQPRWRHRQRFL